MREKEETFAVLFENLKNLDTIKCEFDFNFEDILMLVNIHIKSKFSKKLDEESLLSVHIDSEIGYSNQSV